MNNTIGQSFPNYVRQQLSIRENILQERDRVNRGDNFASYQDLMFLSNVTGWVTLRSSVQLQKGTDLYNYFTSKAPFSNSTEKDLAKYYVLNGGLSYSNASLNPNGKSNLRSGFLDSKGNSFEGSYGMGGTDEQGFRPMPGIQSMNLVFKTENGALREATIRVKAFNLYQLEVIDTLYMKLGMSAILEWGHTPYAKNDGSVETKTAIIPFYDIKSKEGVLKAIAKQREISCGNYDGLFGKISNFDWAANPDGTYDCTIKLLGLGDVIESLKINVTNGKTTSVELPILTNPNAAITGGQGVEYKKIELNPNQISSLYTEAIDAYKQSSIKDFPGNPKSVKVYQTTNTPIITQNLFSAGVLSRYFDKGPIAKTSGGLDIIYGAKGFNADLMAGRVEAEQVPTVSNTIFKRVTIPYVVNVGETTSQGDASPSDANTVSCYLTLGHLLALLVNNSLLYEGESGAQKPYISIDFNPETNFCFTTPYQVSINPLVCLIPYEPGNFDTTKEELIKNVPGNFITKDNNLLSDHLIKKGLGFKTSDNANKGYLMKILVHVDYATELFNSFITDKNSEVPLLPYLENLLSGISEALGRINLFRVGFDDEANVIRIYDDQIIPEKQDAPVTLNLFGTKSLYKEYSFQSKISNNIATTIAISNSTSGEGSGIDGTGFSKIAKDRGAFDRILKNEGVGNYKVESTPENDASKLDSIREHVYQIYTQNTVSKANVDSVKTVYNDRCNKLKANNAKTRGLPIIPVDFNVNMDGISGITKLQVFTIPNALLPRAYSVGVKDSGIYKVAFVVYGLEHSIENNTWTTKIRAGMINSTQTK